MTHCGIASSGRCARKLRTSHPIGFSARSSERCRSPSAMLPQSLVDRLRYVEIYTTRAVRAHRAGDYLSRIRGRSFEFDQHKPYQQGDDYRQMDWNATARMQVPYVKRELEEKELSAVIMVDLSRSMLFT